MKQNLIKKPCPVCKTPIGMGLFTNREKITRCPNCGALLIVNPKRIKTQLFILAGGILLWIALSYWLGAGLLWLVLIEIFTWVISEVFINFTTIKKDFVIRNKQTNKISYVNKADWNEIIKKNNFEIIEELKNDTTANNGS